MPTISEFVSALRSIELKPGQAKMLRAHYCAPNPTLTATHLAQAADQKDYQPANLWYGKLGRSIALALGTTPDSQYDDGTPIWLHARRWLADRPWG